VGTVLVALVVLEVVVAAASCSLNEVVVEQVEVVEAFPVVAYRAVGSCLGAAAVAEAFQASMTSEVLVVHLRTADEVCLLETEDSGQQEDVRLQIRVSRPSSPS